MREPSRTASLVSLALGLALAAGSASATPPAHAPAHGWRAKHDPYYVGYTGNHWERDYGIRAMMTRGYHGILVRDATTGMETHETLAHMTCTRGQIATLEQFDAYSLTSAQLISTLRQK